MLNIPLLFIFWYITIHIRVNRLKNWILTWNIGRSHHFVVNIWIKILDSKYIIKQYLNEIMIDIMIEIMIEVMIMAISVWDLLV